MTHDIILEISSSLDANGNPKKYHVVSGSIFNDAFNEELDSVSIVLDHVFSDDRLTEIQPYDFVRVYDNASYDALEQKYLFDKHFVLDSFIEKETNIFEHIYEYTLQLFSETKLLEKVQCPNLTITHRLEKNGSVKKRPIYEYIQQYMELYGKKIKKLKGNNEWEYKPLINVPPLYEFEIVDDIEVKNPLDTSERKLFHFNQIVGFSSDTNVCKYHVSVSNAIFTSLGSHFSPDNYLINLFSYGNYEKGKVVEASNGFRFSIEKVDISNIQYSSGYFRGDLSVVVDIQSDTFSRFAGMNLTQIEQELSSVLLLFGFTFFTTKYSDVKVPTEFGKKFDVPCADMSFNMPTLRQLLTALMQQVGCIPVVNNLTLGYLDFSEEANNFVKDNTINYVQRSLSSDSYANTIVDMPSSVLDSENEVISETLGFRDSGSILIKQTSNLKLETKFPIYKVNKFYIHFFVNSSVNETYYGLNTNINIREYLGYERIGETLGYGSSYVDYDSAHNKYREARMVISISGGSYYNINEIKLTGEFVLIKFNEKTFSWEEIRRIPLGDDYYLSDDNYPEFEAPVIFGNDYRDIDTAKGSFYFNGTFQITDKLNNHRALTPEIRTFFTDIKFYNIHLKEDITPLLVENSIRQTLETNFLAMREVESVEELSKYIYGTVGYSIGSNQISGFSSMYSETDASVFGPITLNKTYIENIISVLLEIASKKYENKNLEVDSIKGIPYVTDDKGNRPYCSTKINTMSGLLVDSSLVNFAQCFFDIQYQPMNSFNMAFTKLDRDLPFAIEQYNSSASGVSDFDRLSTTEQEIVDRIGNQTLSISQRVTNLSQVKPLNSKYVDGDTEYVVFRRTISVNNNCYNVQYVASENAVLKNYFTSIRTKYRAYQYVDYNQSIVRKEKDIVYVNIDKEYFNGDDKIYFGSDKIGLFDGCIVSDSAKKIYYECENADDSSENNITVKNDISVVTNENSVLFIYENPDNASAGTQISNLNFETYIDTETVTGKIGGVPQNWIIWGDEYYDKHFVSYAFEFEFENKLNSEDGKTGQLTIDDAEIYIKQIALMPQIDSELYTYSPSNCAFTVCDDNTSDDLRKTFYKDLSERINHTVQFIFYTRDKDVLWTELMFKNSSFIRSTELIPNAVVALESDQFSVNKESNTIGTLIDTQISDYISIDTHNGQKCLKVTIPISTYCLKVVHKNEDNSWNDIIAFRKPEGVKGEYTAYYYVSLNDTLSDWVLAEKDGILCKHKKIKKNTLNRELEA